MRQYSNLCRGSGLDNEIESGLDEFGCGYKIERRIRSEIETFIAVRQRGQCQEEDVVLERRRYPFLDVGRFPWKC